uniref:DegT/DnrJ/EryC1/StrS aminotransferase family protein n=1 Tax=viral metagenome TaxID=1070528 RepID=A0A6C0KF67_9ZZZZ
MIPIYEPYIEKYKSSAIKAINDNWISNYGINVRNSEEKIKKILNIKYCILMNNGTSATHCLLLALKYKYPDINKIYIPNNVFIAPWNCVYREFEKDKIEVMKINSDTMNIDTSEEYLNSLEKNSCIFIVHNLGNIINVPRIKRIRPDIIIIEDNCEGIFGKYEEYYSGTYKDTLCSAVSFYANKTITTGEGGAFFTNDNDVFEYINSIHSHSMTKERYIHDKLAYNYRMTNVQAGFLYDQLSDIEHILNLKKIIFNNYDIFLNNLIKMKQIKKLESEDFTTSSNWMYCIIINILEFDFNDFENYMNEKLVQVRPFFYDIRKHTHLKDTNVKYDEIMISNNGIMLPSYPGLTIEKQEYICNCIKEYINK